MESFGKHVFTRCLGNNQTKVSKDTNNILRNKKMVYSSTLKRALKLYHFIKYIQLQRVKQKKYIFKAGQLICI